VTTIFGAGDNQDDVLALLHPRVRELVRGHLGWRYLREIQVDAARPVFTAEHDVLIIAGAAAGKTEAAWLPIFSRLLAAGGPGLGVLALNPLKAMIDDQVTRLSGYGRHLGLRVESWQGDIAPYRRVEALETMPDSLVITPETLHGLLIRKPVELTRAVANLRYIVIDEIHVLAGTDRGQQLQSLLHLLDARIGRPVPRIALSASVSEAGLIAEFLRPRAGKKVQVVHSVSSSGPDLDVEVHGFLAGPSGTTAGAGAPGVPGPRSEIAARIDAVTRGRRALVFTADPAAAEEMVALLRDPRVTGTRRPERFLADHDGLPAEARRMAERTLQENDDTAVICTPALDLGADLPQLDLVVQADTGIALTALRQRLGRSGRRYGTRPTLRVYTTERDLAGGGRPDDRLRAGLIQQIASIDLMQDDWVEPADLGPLGLSTLVQQTIVLAADPAGVSAQHAWKLLCQTGPWHRVNPGDYASIVRDLAVRGILRQDTHGRLHLAEAGQRLAGRREFVEVLVNGSDGGVHRRVRERMRVIYEEAVVPGYLDPTAISLLVQGRAGYAAMNLGQERIVAVDGGTLLALWTGDRELATARRWIELCRPDAKITAIDIGLLVSMPPTQLRDVVRALLETKPTGLDLAAVVPNKKTAKFDEYVPEDLLTRDYASRFFDVPAARAALNSAIGAGPGASTLRHSRGARP